MTTGKFVISSFPFYEISFFFNDDTLYMSIMQVTIVTDVSYKCYQPPILPTLVLP
jgi:hypothetical protein